jgi:hypothetical protein
MASSIFQGSFGTILAVALVVVVGLYILNPSLFAMKSGFADASTMGADSNSRQMPSDTAGIAQLKELAKNPAIAQVMQNAGMGKINSALTSGFMDMSGNKMPFVNMDASGNNSPFINMDPSGNMQQGFANMDEVTGPSEFDSAQGPAGCYPRDQLTPSELLPKDPNSVWAQQNPMGQGSLKGKNFLSAGALIGVNTVGQSLRNANLQLRSEPPNPQVPVSVFYNSTIQPDTSHRDLEIN